MVEFNIEEDRRFQGSLEDLGIDTEIDVKSAILATQADELTWDQFVQRHGWAPRQWAGDNTYPGATELYDFVMIGPSGQKYQLTGSSVNEAIVICAIVVKFNMQSRSAAELRDKPAS